MIDLRYLKKLLDILDGSSADSIEIATEKGVKIRVSKSPQGRGAVQVAAPMQMPQMMAPMQGRMTPSEGMQAVQDEVPKAEPKSSGLEVKSPMVGTFYGSPEPGAKPYVSVGSRVSKGQVLCIIEAMKIMNEIESEYSGVIKDIVAENGHPVEYGQVLYRIDPNG